jgi:hypothetical protein
MNNSSFLYFKVDIYTLQYYLQIGYICTPKIVNLSYNEERISGFDFPQNLALMNGLSEDFLGNSEDDGNIILELIGINLTQKKIIGVHISCINRIICSDIQIENLKYLLEGNNIPYNFNIINWGDFNLFIKSKHLKITRINWDSSKNKLHDAWHSLKFKGGMSLLRALPVLIDKRAFTINLLSKPYSFGDDFVNNSGRFLSENIFSEDDFVKLINKYSKFLNKQYGLSAKGVIAHINNSLCYDDLQTLFELTGNLKNATSNLTVLEFAFIQRKYKKLNNPISRDMEKALGEILLAWDNMKLPDQDLMRLVFQIGYVASYGSLYTMEGYSKRAGQLIFTPNLDDLSGLGFEFDKLIENEKPGLFVLPKHGDTLKTECINRIVDSVYFYQYEKLLTSVLKNDGLHRKIAGLKLIFSNFDTNDLKEFHLLLLKLSERFIDHESPHFAYNLLDKIKNKNQISHSEIAFLNFISNGITGVIRILP